MKPRISVITIGVDDFGLSLKFYRDGLGLPTEGIVGKEFEHGAVAFFELQLGVKLAIFPRADLAHDAGIAHPAAVRRSSRSATWSAASGKLTTSCARRSMPAPD
jgi:catechol 2,3-dioxygenase-like lactoylglutathione lyase family enzyme